MTHAELDKIWNKLNKRWKIKALQFIEDEIMIIETAQNLRKAREKAIRENK